MLKHVVDYVLMGMCVLTVYLCLYKVYEFFDLYRAVPKAFRKQGMTWLDHLVVQWKNQGCSEAEARRKMEYQLILRHKFLSWIHILAATGTYVGLCGTILYIMEALWSMNGSTKDFAQVTGPIAHSLYATLYGIAAALLATVAYNACSAKIEYWRDRATWLIGSVYAKESTDEQKPN